MWYILNERKVDDLNYVSVVIDSACCRDKVYVYEEHPNGDIFLEGIKINEQAKIMIQYARSQGFIASKMLPQYKEKKV